MSEAVENRIEELLLQYTYFYGIRRSNNDKKNFYAYIDQQYKTLGYPVTFGKLPAGITRMGYCIAGDLETAQQVFIAPVNTKRKTYFPGYRYYPFHEQSTTVNNALAAITDTLFGVLICLAVWIIGWKLSSLNWVGFVCGAVAYAVYVFSRKGIFNFNASAPLALMHYLAIHCKNRKKYAFVFLDRSVDDYLSLKLFLIKHKSTLEKKNRIIFWNNLAGGTQLVLAGDTPDRAPAGLAQELKANYHILPEKNKPKCFGITDNLWIMCGADSDNKQRYYVKNLRSKKDRKMDVKRLKHIAQTILASDDQR